MRVLHSDHHIETRKEIHGKETESAHFLRFTKAVEELGSQYTAIAFELQALPNVSAFDSTKRLSKQFRIVPAAPGRVAVFFTAAKETSGLRFHLHAPFVPELSRASIKDTPMNMPLFRQVADLSASSLFAVRDLGLLDRDFLAVLPNPNDDLPARYECIRDAIVDAMNEHPLAPKRSGGHAPARQLLQAGAGLKGLLSVNDIRILTDFEGLRYWAVSVTQRNSAVDYFLRSLSIEEWDIEEFVKVLEARLDTRSRFDNKNYRWIYGPDKKLLAWLHSKSDEWHQKLYALLWWELESGDKLHQLEKLCIVRLSSGKHKSGNECYFPTEDVREDPILPRVAGGYVHFCRGKIERDRARKFLKTVGVREVGEQEQVEAILKQRYSEQVDIPNKKTYRNDLRRFIALMENDAGAADLFRKYRIFELEDGNWGRPDRVYLDAPYTDSGLHNYYRSLKDKSKRVTLAESYKNLGISLKKLVWFAQSVGAANELEVITVRCQRNPRWNYLQMAPGSRFTYLGTNEDFTIYGLTELLRRPTVSLSRLVWKTLRDQSYNGRYLRACYQYNQSNVPHYADSQLVYQLRKLSWVPQRGGSFVRPAEAAQDRLPEGFAFDAGWPWIKAIGFGEESAKRVEERHRRRGMARELGFDNDEALEDAKRFAKWSPDTRRRILAEYEAVDLPQHEPSDPERREAKVREQASEAPERTTEKRPRSVSVNREAVKTEETDPYLRSLYTNDDGVTICQACKKALPFKLADGNYYFEKVEFLPELEKHHYQNYLALCPNHAAMYRYANGSTETMKDTFLGLVDGNELEVVLAEETDTVHFNSTHILDLKTIIEAEETERNQAFAH